MRGEPGEAKQFCQDHTTLKFQGWDSNLGNLAPDLRAGTGIKAQVKTTMNSLTKYVHCSQIFKIYEKQY